ncbi:MAG: hypothetical protein HYZ58_04860 [Acidobacteria bacterium]|nr:hypothetical protein [Acidobacteriota bacterium]
MSRFFSKGLLRLALGVLMVLIGQRGQTAAARTPSAEPEPATWAVALRQMPEGGYLFEAAAGELKVIKRMKRAEEMTVAITDGVDTITLDATATGTTVTAHGRSAVFTATDANEESFKTMQALIQSSAAARKFHASLSREPESGQRRLHPDLAITHALLRTLEGDSSAAIELSRQLLGRTPDRIRAVGFSSSCFESWETEVVRAWDDYVACHHELTGIRGALRGMCGWRYALWVESAWFSFLSCSALK